MVETRNLQKKNKQHVMEKRKMVQAKRKEIRKMKQQKRRQAKQARVRKLENRAKCIQRRAIMIQDNLAQVLAKLDAAKRDLAAIPSNQHGDQKCHVSIVNSKDAGLEFNMKDICQQMEGL